MSVMVGMRSAMGAGRFAEHGAGMYGIGPFIVFFFMVLFVAFVAALVWLLVRRAKTHTQAPVAPTQDAALAIARERLARGEIDAEQYISIANALNPASAPVAVAPTVDSSPQG